MISKTIGVTDTTGIHPASIKLPSGRISIEKSNTLSTPIPAAQQHSKRNAIILLSVIFIIFAVLLAVYLFWFKTPPEIKEVASVPPTTSTPHVEIKDVDNPALPKTTENAPAIVEPPKETKTTAISEPTKPKMPPTTENISPAGKTAAQAFEEQGKSATKSPPIEVDTSVDEARRKALEEEKRRSDERKRQQAALAAKRRKLNQEARLQTPPPPPPQQDVPLITDFKRVK
jgi:hypothetical protein